MLYCATYHFLLSMFSISFVTLGSYFAVWVCNHVSFVSLLMLTLVGGRGPSGTMYGLRPVWTGPVD
jgi:hypothetical protein